MITQFFQNCKYSTPIGCRRSLLFCSCCGGCGCDSQSHNLISLYRTSLAYHYHTLNLRNLIVAVDPLSSESPSDILQKWRLLTDLDVREWTDSSYMPASFLKTGMTPTKYIQKTKEFQNMTEEAVMEVSNHRYRQRVFLAQCMKAFRQAGLSWVVHIVS